MKITPNHILRSRLFHAISASLVLGIGATASVQAKANVHSINTQASACSAIDGTQAKRTCESAQAAYLQTKHVALPAATTHSVVVQTSDPGAIGNPDSWRTDEFEQDWGLAAINAQYAYARGLTGKGIRIGLFDSGAGLEHPEFAGKNHHGLHIGDIDADGNRCAANSYILGDTTCFGTDGGTPQLDATYFDETFANYSVTKHLAGKVVYTYGAHGTHVAGTMAANRDGEGMHGVAFDANFSSARLFADSLTFVTVRNGYITSLGALSMQPSASAFVDMYSQMNADGVRALNHSWGLANEPSNAAGQNAIFNNPAMQERFNAMRDGSLAKGMIQVWAAGNTKSVISTPTQSPIAGIYASLPRFMPELEEFWLSVVNVSQTDNPDAPYVLSNRSMKCGLSANWCLAAPGTDITSTVYGVQDPDSFWGGWIGGNLDDLMPDEDGNFSLDPSGLTPTYDYDVYSGTSMAAPHVTGALALLFERYPYLSNPQIRDIMLTTATDMGAPGVDEIYGWGMLNLKKAIEGFGQFRVDTDVVMNTKAGGLRVWSDARIWDDWTNDIGGPGRLSFASVNGGWLRLSGDNSFNGISIKSGTLELSGNNALTDDVTVNGGVFRLTGNLTGSNLNIVGGTAVINGQLSGGDTFVGTGGILGGSGSLGNTTVAGTIAPGNSIGNLTINGNYVQQAGSKFLVEMQPPSANDTITINGTATLNGGTVVALRTAGVYGLGQSYNFLTATQGISGTFAGVDNSLFSPFAKMQLRYSANSAYADVVRAAALASVATTANQHQTAGAIDALSTTNSLLQKMVFLDATNALKAFDQLSGDLHPSLRNVLLEDGRQVRQAALARAGSGHDAFSSQSTAPGATLWVDILGNGNQLESDGNATGLRSTGNQTLVGGDYQFDNGLRIGALGGTSRNDATTVAHMAKGKVTSRTFALLGGQRWGAFGLHGGASLTSHDISTQRSVNVPGVAQALQGQYDSRTQQLFIEGGYQFSNTSWQLEPYVQYAYVKAESDAFTETGGDAALSARKSSNTVDLTTMGLRGAMNLKGSQQEQSWLSLRAGLAYRFASADRTPATSMAFGNGATFTTWGAPIADKATLVELGLAARMSERVMLEVGYNGQYSDEGRDHAANLRLSFQF